MWEHIAVAIATAAFLLNLLVTLIGGIWKLSRMELGLRQAISLFGKEIDDRIEEQARHTGETAAALRQKITEVEIWARDNFVRRDSFYKVTGDLSTDIKDLGKDIKERLDSLGKDTNTRFDRVENRIDEKG